MKTRLARLFLALFLLCSWQAPVIAQAAETEPMVLQSHKYNSNLTTYHYDAKGNCVREESVKLGTVYEYIYDDSNTLVQEKYYKNNRLTNLTDYDSRGELIAYWGVDENGKQQKIIETNYVYDAYGRKILREEHDLGTSSKLSEQYEYHSPPKTLIFGHYEQDGNPDNGAEPIEWIILDTDGDYTLVVSKYGLNSQRYEKSGTGVSWNESDLRQWLNGEFEIFAFTFAERMNINPVQMEGTIGKDDIFLLSLDQVNQYFSSDAERICTPTAYALDNKAQADKKTGACWWPLRTAGNTDTRVARVNVDGSIDSKGVSVSEAGGAVRPALWIKTSAAEYGPQTPNCIYTNVHYADPDVLSIHNPISKTEIYDDAGRLIGSRNHITNESVYITYDIYGNVIDKRTTSIYSEDEVFNRETTENTYDKDGRLKKTKIQYTEINRNFSDNTENTFSSHIVITYAYDADDRLIRRVSKDDDGSTTTEEWTYDAAGRPLRETSKSDHITSTTVWTYREDGSSTCQTSEQSGKKNSTIILEYDSHGNLLKKYTDGILVEENVYVPLSQAQWKN